MLYAQEAQQQARKLNYKNGLASSYNNIGLVYINQGNYNEALTNCLISLKIKKEIKNKKGIAACYGNIGNIYFYQGNYEKALANQLKSLAIKEEIKDKKGIAFSYTDKYTSLFH